MAKDKKSKGPVGNKPAPGAAPQQAAPPAGPGCCCGGMPHQAPKQAPAPQAPSPQ